MQGHGILTVEDLNTGSVLKQGDRTLLKFRLKDYDNETLDIKGKSCKVVLLSVDYTGKIDIAETVVEEDGIVRFSIEVDLLPTIYFMEFIVDGKYVFPSKHTHYWTITPSSLGADVNTIETVGVDDLVERVLTQVADRQIDLSDYATIEFVKKHFEKFELTDEQREKLRGEDGKSITITNTTTDEQGNTLITFSDETIVTIQRGLSAFEVWEKQPNNKGKSVDDFFDFIKGDGVDDDSIWKTALQKDDVFSKDEIDFTNLYSINATEIFHKKIRIQDYGDSGMKKSVVDVIFYREEHSSFDLSSIEYISIKNLFIKIPSDYINRTSMSVYTFTLDEFNEVFGTYLKLLPNAAARIDFPIDVEIMAWFRKEV